MTYKKVAIVQSCYIPWKGYFDLINSVDLFIIYDEVQFTRSDWRNRNIIKTLNGQTRFLTIPFTHRFPQKISEVAIADPDWYKKHLDILKQNYKDAACFEETFSLLRTWYEKCKSYTSLSEINVSLLKDICAYLTIRTPLEYSDLYPRQANDRVLRLIEILTAVEATHYISGPAAKAYLDESMFRQAGIELSYIDYSNYPEYNQPHGVFDHAVSILDLILNQGSEASFYMKSFGHCLERSE